MMTPFLKTTLLTFLGLTLMIPSLSEAMKRKHLGDEDQTLPHATFSATDPYDGDSEDRKVTSKRPHSTFPQSHDTVPVEAAVVAALEAALLPARLVRATPLEEYLGPLYNPENNTAAKALPPHSGLRFRTTTLEGGVRCVMPRGSTTAPILNPYTAAHASARGVIALDPDAPLPPPQYR